MSKCLKYEEVSTYGVLTFLIVVASGPDRTR